MGTSHCRRLRGFILLHVLFLSFVLGLASTIDISFHGGEKRSLSSSSPSPRGAIKYTLCADHSQAKDGKPIPLDFTCKNGYVMSTINFADYGQSTGSCGKFKRGQCGARNTLNIVKKKCLGRKKCELFVPDKIFGPSHCKGPIKLVIDATCKKA